MVLPLALLLPLLTSLPSIDRADHKLTAAELSGLSLTEITLMRNAIYARAGNVFRKRWLSDYFTERAWYHPTGLDESKLTALDRQNAKVIAVYEASIDRAQLKARLKRTEEDQKLDPLFRITELRLLREGLGEPEDGQFNTPLEEPNQLDTVLVQKHLEDLSRRDLLILRNMVYARRGRPFKSAVLATYFRRTAWYRADPAYTDARLTATDKRNIAIVQDLESKLGGPLTDADPEAAYLSRP